MSKYHTSHGPFSVQQIADYLKREVSGNADKQISEINALQDANENGISFLDNPKYIQYADSTKAAAVIIHPALADKLPEGVVAILSPQPYADYARTLELFYGKKEQEESISERAEIHPTAKLGKNVIIEAGVFIAEGVEIGNNVTIEANTRLGKFVKVGPFTTIKSNVSIECAEIGAYCLIYAGARIGQDGFGFAFDPTNIQILKVHQIGGVKIGNYVEIGANSTIDRGAVGDTVIGDMTKLDNLVQIGHGAKIGRLCRFVAQTGVAGSTEIGDGCLFGGQSGVAGHLKITDQVTLASRGAITKNISQVGSVLGGIPAVPLREWKKAHAILMRMVKGKRK